jgi:hypothetical protein
MTRKQPLNELNCKGEGGGVRGGGCGIREEGVLEPRGASMLGRRCGGWAKSVVADDAGDACQKEGCKDPAEENLDPAKPT